MYSEGERRGLLFGNIKSEWSAGNFHWESTEQQRLSRMDINTLPSRSDRSIMGEQLSKMNSISTASQYKCHKLRRTSASSSLVISSYVNKRELASKKQWVKPSLIHKNNCFRKDPPVSCQICCTVRLHTSQNTDSHSCSPLKNGNFNAVTDSKQYDCLCMLISQVTPKHQGTI